MWAHISDLWQRLSNGQRFVAGIAAGAALSVLSALSASTLEASLGVHAPNMAFLCSVIFAAIWFGRRVALVTASV